MIKDTPALSSYRQALRIGLRKPLMHSPGLSLIELVILLCAPFDSIQDAADLTDHPYPDVSIYIRALLAHGLLSASAQGKFSLSAKGLELLAPAHASRS